MGSVESQLGAPALERSGIVFDLWASYFASLCLTFLICKRWIMVAIPQILKMESVRTNAGKMLRTVHH